MAHQRTHTLLSGLAIFCLTSLILSGCGRPEYCEQAGAQSYTGWKGSTWAPYCENLREHIQTPLNYKLTDLTRTFASYPEKRKALQAKLASYEEPARCSKNATEELAYREHVSCIEDTEAQYTNMERAWSLRADKWLEEFEVRMRTLKINLDKATRQGNGLMNTAGERLEGSEPLDKDEVEPLEKAFVPLQKETIALGGAKKEHEVFMSIALENQRLSEFIQSNYGTKLQAFMDRHEANRVAIAKLSNQLQFIRHVEQSSGKTCPLPRGSSSSSRTAKKVLSKEITPLLVGKKSLVGTRVQKSATKEGGKQEVIEGVFCGKRNSDDQFEGMPKLCTTYTFKIKRERAKDARKFGDWSIVSTTEGDLKKGVDCKLIK